MNRRSQRDAEEIIMKSPKFLILAVAVARVNAASAQQIQTAAPPARVNVTVTGPAPVYQPAPPVQVAVPRMVYVYDQKPLPEMPAPIPPPQAQEIVDRFRTNYARLENPRILIYVNRDLVDEQSGIRLSARSETIETTTHTGASTAATNPTVQTEASASKSVVNNNYRTQERPAPSLADRQTVRDVERLIGRPLRMAGATLVDQRVATQLIGDKPLQDLASGTEAQQAAKDRAAVSKIADVVLEVLISSRNVTVPEVSGDRTYTIPDIQTTAVRLKDAKVIGQATASDVMGGSPGYAARNFSVQAITEATALALMDDILRGLQ
jgi:hypothetical protein